MSDQIGAKIFLPRDTQNDPLTIRPHYEYSQMYH